MHMCSNFVLSRRVSANMTTCLYSGQIPSIITEINHIPEAELRIINCYQANQKEKGYISITTPDGGYMWVYPHLLYANDWPSTTSAKLGGKDEKKKSKDMDKPKSKSYNVVSASSRDVDSNVIPHKLKFL